MKKIFMLVFVSCLLFSCSTTRKPATTSTVIQEKKSIAAGVSGDGSSFETAIVIHEKSESKGVDAEYKWLAKNYPGYKMISQSLSYHDKKPYDVLSIKTKDDEKKEVYFDISDFFGKF